MSNPLDPLVRGMSNLVNSTMHQKPIATQLDHATLLQLRPDRIVDLPTGSEKSDIFGTPFTYHRFASKDDQKKIEGFETSIGNFNTMMPLAAVGGFAAGQMLSPVRKILRGVPGSFLLNPLILAGGAGAVSALLALQKKEQMNNYLAGRIGVVQGGSDPLGRDLSAMSMETIDPETGIRKGFSALNHTSIQGMLERIDDVARERGGVVSDIPSGMYSNQDGTHLYARTPKADLYENVTLPQDADDENITLEQMTYVRNDGKMDGRLTSAPTDPIRRKAMFMREVIQKSGLKSAAGSSDVGFIAKNKKIYSHALNLFKAKHSAVNNIFESVKKDIRKASDALRQDLAQQRPFSMSAMRNKYIHGVLQKIKTEVSEPFKRHPDMLKIIDSFLFKEYHDIMDEYKYSTR